MRQAVVLLQDAAHPDVPGGKKSGATDAPAAQVPRRRDALGRIDEDKTVSESAMQKHRQGSPRKITIARGEIGGGVEFADVEFLAVSHAVVALGRTHAAEHHEVDAVRL